MSLSDIDKREVCEVHGWVGRKVFQNDRHDLCVAPEEDPPPDDDELADDAPSDPDPEDADAVVADAILDEDSEDDGSAAEDVAVAEPRWSRAAARRRGIPPKKTLAVRRITQVDLAAGRAELRALGADAPYESAQDARRLRERAQAVSLRRLQIFVVLRCQ